MAIRVTSAFMGLVPFTATVVVSTTCFEKGPPARSSTSPQLVAACPVCLSRIEGDILFFLEKNDDSVAVMCAPPAAGFLHEEGRCQDVCEEGNAGVSRWNVWFTPDLAAGISISYHFGTLFFSRKVLCQFFSRENSCSD